MLYIIIYVRTLYFNIIGKVEIKLGGSQIRNKF